MKAARGGYAKVVDILLKHNARVDLEDKVSLHKVMQGKHYQYFDVYGILVV